MVILFVFFLCLCRVKGHKVSSSSSSSHLGANGAIGLKENQGPVQKLQDVLVLDVDGTLYEDDCSIETQIRDNCFVWSRENHGIDPERCQAMHERWGSTIRGICEELSAPVTTTVCEYYNAVYPSIHMGRLRKYNIAGFSVHEAWQHPYFGMSEMEFTFTNESVKSVKNDKALSGWDSLNNLRSGEVLRSLKRIAGSGVPVVVASNSPIFHVKRVLTRLGLANLPVAAFLTPERIGGVLKTDKHFWQPLLDLYVQISGSLR